MVGLEPSKSGKAVGRKAVEGGFSGNGTREGPAGFSLDGDRNHWRRWESLHSEWWSGVI